MLRLKLIKSIPGIVSICSTCNVSPKTLLVNHQMISEQVNRKSSTITQPSPVIGSNHNNILLMMGFLGFLWNRTEEKYEEDDETNVLLLPVKKLIFKANMAVANLEYNKAEEYLHEALHALSDPEHSATQPFIEARAVVLDKLGNMYLECGEWEKAVSTLTTVISLLRISEVEEDSATIIELSLNISKAYTNMKRFDQARTGFEWCVTKAQAILERDKTDENIALLGMCLQSKGQFHLMVKEPAMAYKSYLLAIECATKVYGDHHSQLAVVMNDSASALDAMGQFEKAEEVIRDAIAIVEKCKDDNYHENMTVFLMNLAAAQRNQGHTLEAMETYRLNLQHAYKIRHKTLLTEIKQLINSLK